MRAVALVLSLFVLACAGGDDDDDDDDDLFPRTPPLVEQVFVLERVGTAMEWQLAYGDHPDIPASDDRVVSDAIAEWNQIRIVLSEPIELDVLATVLCNDGTFDVPMGKLSPQDIADCIGIDLRDCTAVCTEVGILDEDEDGQPDERALDPGAADVVCDGLSRTAGGAGPRRSPYDATGDQTYDPTLGAESLGPAIVLETGYLGLSATCSIEIADGVTNANGDPICAPHLDGDCSAGDTSVVEFQTEGCQLLSSDPADGATGVDPNTVVLLELNIPIDYASIEGISITDSNGAAVPATVETKGNDSHLLILNPGVLNPLETYTVSIPPPCAATVTFTTGS